MNVVGAALWSVAQYGAGKAVTFVSTAILARLIDPDAFGLLAMGLLAVNVFDRMKDVGVGAALVRSPRRFAAIAPTGALLTMIGSVVLAAVCFGSAGVLAELLGDRRATNIIRALALSLLVSGLAVLPDAVLRRRLLFKQRTVPEVVGVLIKATVSIGLALVGADVWSLVWGQLAGSLVTTGLYWITARRQLNRPVFGFSSEQARQLLSFGAPVSAIALLALVLDNLDYFVIGHRLGAQQLGYYTMAFRLPELLVLSVCAVIGQVLFSSFSGLQDDPASLRSHYLSAAATVACISVPVGLGLSAAAPDIIAAVLGPMFGDAVGPLRLLGISVAVYSLSFHAGEVYKATGRTRLMINLSLCRLVIFAPTLWWAAGYSIEAVAAAVLLLQVIFTAVRLALIRKVLQLQIRDQVAAIRPAVLASVPAALAVFGLGLLIPAGLGTAPRLAILAVVGIGLYLTLISRWDHRFWSRLQALRGRAPVVRP